MSMSLEDLKQTKWYRDLPEIVKQAVNQKPPSLYKMKSGKQCYIISYEEPGDNSPNVTCTVQKTGVGGSGVVPSYLDSNKVFGVELDDLTDWI